MRSARSGRDSPCRRLARRICSDEDVGVGFRHGPPADDSDIEAVLAAVADCPHVQRSLLVQQHPHGSCICQGAPTPGHKPDLLTPHVPGSSDPEENPPPALIRQTLGTGSEMSEWSMSPSCGLELVHPSTGARNLECLDVSSLPTSPHAPKSAARLGATTRTPFVQRVAVSYIGLRLRFCPFLRFLIAIAPPSS
jgi:hypothetical protein